MPKFKKVFYGWWIVLASATINFLSGGSFLYGFTVFFNPIRETFHWQAAVTSVAFTLQRLESGVMGPIAGYLVDRVSPKKLMMVGWAIFGLGFVLMSRINSLWSFYATFLLIAAGLSFGSFVVINAAIARWFKKKRSRALTFIYVGFGLSGTLVPLLALAVKSFGWQTTLLWMGIILGTAGILLSFVMRDRPERYGYLPDGETADVAVSPAVDKPLETQAASGGQEYTARQALRTPSFWLLSLAFLFQHLGTSAVMVHVVPYLESVGISTGVAATTVTGITVCSLIGRLGFGILGDFTNKRYLIAISLVLQTAGLFIFAFVSKSTVWLLILFLLTYAPGYGGPIPLRPALQADYFGTKSFGTIMGLMSMVSIAGGLLSPIFAGWVYDTMQSYHNAWLVLATATLPSVVFILLAKPPRPIELQIS